MPNFLKWSISPTPHIAGYSYDGKVAGMIMIYEAACNFLKIKPLHTINDFLPPPPIPSIELNAPSDDQQALRHLTEKDLRHRGRRHAYARNPYYRQPTTAAKFFDDFVKSTPSVVNFKTPLSRYRQDTAIDMSLAELALP